MQTDRFTPTTGVEGASHSSHTDIIHKSLIPYASKEFSMMHTYSSPMVSRHKNGGKGEMMQGLPIVIVAIESD